jgi:hypothetical protein
MLLRRCAGWAVGLFLVSGVVTPLMGGKAAGSRVRINTLIERLVTRGY